MNICGQNLLRTDSTPDPPTHGLRTQAGWAGCWWLDILSL